MKFNLILYILFLTQSISIVYGQQKGCPIEILASKMEVLYIGVDNPVYINVPNINNQNKVSVSIHQGEVSISQAEISGMRSTYLARVYQTGEAKIMVKVTKNDTLINEYQKEFRVKNIPDPIPYFNNQKGDILMDINSIQKQDRIKVLIGSFDFDVIFTVISYDMLLINDGKIYKFSTIGSLLSNEMKETLKNIKLGDKLLFENIKVKGPDGIARKISGINVTITDKESSFSTEIHEADTVYTFVSQMPKFEGDLPAYIRKNLVIPKEIDSIAKVYVAFVVGKTGEIRDVQIIRGYSSELDTEVSRAVIKMPPWKPAEQNGRPVSFKMVLPIIVNLKD